MKFTRNYLNADNLQTAAGSISVQSPDAKFNLRFIICKLSNFYCIWEYGYSKANSGMIE